MQSINMEFVQNLLASFKELQAAYEALQKRMAEFEAMATAKFEAYEAELAKKDAVIASLQATIAKQEAELERYREKDKTNSSNSHMPPSKDKTKSAHKDKKARDKSAKKQGAQPGHKGSGLSLPTHYDRLETSTLTPIPCHGCPERFTCSSLACSRVRETRYEVDIAIQEKMKRRATPGVWWNGWQNTRTKYAYFSPTSLCPLTTTRRNATSGRSKQR